MEPHPFRMDKTQHGKDEITDERLKPEIRLEIRASFRTNSHRGHYDHRIDCCGANVVTCFPADIGLQQG